MGWPRKHNTAGIDTDINYGNIAKNPIKYFILYVSYRENKDSKRSNYISVYYK